MNVIIPVAGEGTRLRPYTHTTPKQLLLVAGTAAIDHIMQCILTLHPHKIYFVTGHLRHKIEHYMRTTYPQEDMSFIEQTGPYGTGTAVYCARQAFNEPVLIDFGDTLFDTDLSIVQENQDDGIIWSKYREDYQRFGVIVTNDAGYMERIVEKPKEPISNLVNVGLYYIRNTKLLQEALEHILSTHQEGNEVWLTLAFQYMIDKGAKFKVVECKQWFDCGTPEALLDANQAMLRTTHTTTHHEGATIKPPVNIHQTAHITNSHIGPNVTIGAHTTIRNSTITNSIIDEGSTIIDTELHDSILGKQSTVHTQSLSAFMGDHSRIIAHKHN